MRSDHLHGLRSYLLLVLLVAIGLCAGTAAAAAPLDLSNDTGTVPEYGTALSLAVLDRLSDDSITLTAESNNTSVAVVRSSITDPGFYEIIPGVAGTAEIVFHDTTSGRTGTFILTVISDPAAVPPTVDAVRLSPETASASPGALVRFYARPVNTSSGPVPGVEVSWSDGSRTGTADAANDSCIDYRIPANAPAGPVSITSSCANGVEAVFSLEVVPHVLTDITLVSSRSVLSYIDSFTVTAVGNDGHVFDPGDILWEVGDTRILVMDGSVSANSARFITGTTDGVTTITASVAGGPSADLSVTVGAPPTPAPTQSPSSSDSEDTGSGHYDYYPRSVTNGGHVSFGTSQTVSGVTLPEGVNGEVILVFSSSAKAPAGYETYAVFEINIPNYPNGENAEIQFQLTASEIELAGYTPDDVCLYHFGESGWTALPTIYYIENGIIYYTAVTSAFSPFAIVFDTGAASASVTMTPSAEPEATAVPTAAETLTPSSVTTVTVPAAVPTKSPAPIFTVIVGALAAAVVLRRK